LGSTGNAGSGLSGSYPVSYPFLSKLAGQDYTSAFRAHQEFLRDPDEQLLMEGYFAFGANEVPIMQNLNEMLDYLAANYALTIDDKE